MLLFIVVAVFLFSVFISLLTIYRSYDIRGRAAGVPVAVIADITSYPIKYGSQNSQPQAGKALVNSVVCLLFYPLVNITSCK